ncbi:MAG TPA: tetratricopeptide repeat protein, partial [Ktedonobacterales bacterium]|nr:tetratricopeptide repeat protein [Ktedonobacterales bacterium]
MEHRVLHLLDKTPEKHIHEPVLASCLVSPKGDAKHRLMMVAVGGVIKGIVPGEGVGAELVKKGLEHGAEAAADKLRERKEEREGAVALPPQMYLAMGASKLGLYAVTQRSLLYFIQGELLLVPHEQVAELSIGQTHLTTMDLTLRLRNGLTLELECGKGEHLYLEQMEARLSQVHPAPPSGSLPGYGMQPPAPVAAPSMTKEYWVQEGRTAARARRFGDALAAYEAALALDPTLGPAYFGRGEALRLLNRPAEALPAFERAIQLSPQDAAPYRHAGYVLNTLKRSSEAFSALEQALRLDPTQAGAYVGIGEALQGMQRPAEALAAY